MKDLIKYIFLFCLLIFSFYYTDKVSIMIINKSSLMETIKSNTYQYKKDAIDAIIDKETIIPGINGLTVNELESYYQMKHVGIFDKDKLVFQEMKPSISINNHKGLIINKGHYDKKGVALVFKDNTNILEYIKSNNLKITRAVNASSFNKDAKYEQISIDDETNKLFIKYKLNNNICLLDYQNKETCLQDNKYLVQSTYHIHNTASLTKKALSGDIIFIDDNLSISEIKMLLKSINYQDLSLYYLSELISEKRAY